MQVLGVCQPRVTQSSPTSVNIDGVYIQSDWQVLFTLDIISAIYNQAYFKSSLSHIVYDTLGWLSSHH